MTGAEVSVATLLLLFVINVVVPIAILVGFYLLIKRQGEALEERIRLLDAKINRIEDLTFRDMNEKLDALLADRKAK